MTTISAKTVADSVSREGSRLTTMLLRYPRCIHAEFMTHRVFSRNAASSRAIPVKKLIQDVLDDPFMPLVWGKNQKGMTAGAEHDAEVILGFGSDDYQWGSREDAWLTAMHDAIKWAKTFDEAGYHKQIVNRLLEPFAHITVVVTATEWSNFLALRDHPAAEPHIAMLAREMKAAMGQSTPKLLEPGQWHLPFTESNDPGLLQENTKLSVARCASTSYKTVDGFDMTPERAVRLHDDLVGAHPMHASPAEHQATPDVLLIPGEGGLCPKWQNGHEHGNLRGWRQYRKQLKGECQ